MGVRGRVVAVAGVLSGVLSLGGCDREAQGPAPQDTAPPAKAASGDAPPSNPIPGVDTRQAPAEPAPHFVTSDRVDTTVDGKGDGPYTFTAHWHTQRLATWREQLAQLKGKPNLRYLEIGVFEGRSVLWMLENVLTDPSSKVTAVDVFMGDYEQTFDENIAASGRGEAVTKIKGPSQSELRKMTEPFDVIYIDGSHTADDVLADAVLSWPLLAEGGILIFDDYGWNGRPTGSAIATELRPQIAIDAFVTAYRNELQLMHREYQVFVRRKHNPCEVKDYCSPVGQYRYFWRELELRDADGKVVETTPQERQLIEVIAKSKRIGDVDFTFDSRFVASPEFQALKAKLKLTLPTAAATPGG